MADLNYHHLRYFQAVARDGTLTGAARALNLSQSALSTQIRHLEARLGQVLFDRRGRGLALTEAGRIALAHADRIFAAGEEMLDSLRGHGAAGPRVIRIGALATLSRNFQIGFVAPLLGRADVSVVLRSGRSADLIAALAALDLDVVLDTQPPALPGGFRAHRLADQAVGLIGTRDRVGAGGSLPGLLGTRPVVAPAPGTGVRAQFDALCADLAVSPRIAAEVDDMAMMRLLARRGAGLAVLPPIVVEDELATGLLVEAAPLPGIVESFYAVTKPRQFPNPLVQELLDARA